MPEFEQWAIVELFGHNRIAGMVTEQTIGGCSFVRIDVPPIENRSGFTKLYGQGAIYAITFTDEETATAAAKSFAPRPIDAWTARELLERPEQPTMEELYDDD